MLSTSTVGGFRDELQKIASRAGLRRIVQLFRKGEVEAANALAKTPGVLHPSAAGSSGNFLGRLTKDRRLRRWEQSLSQGDLGVGSEGLATLVAHPEHGVSVRKLFAPYGNASEELLKRKAELGKATQGNEAFARWLGEGKAPSGATMHFSEYVPHVELPAHVEENLVPMVRGTRAEGIKAARKAGFRNLTDTRLGNMGYDAAKNRFRILDATPAQAGEFVPAGAFVTRGKKTVQLPSGLQYPTEKGKALLNLGNQRAGRPTLPQQKKPVREEGRIVHHIRDREAEALKRSLLGGEVLPSE